MPRRKNVRAPAKRARGVSTARILRNAPNKIMERARFVKVLKGPDRGLAKDGKPELRFITISREVSSKKEPPRNSAVRLLSSNPERVWVTCDCENFTFQWEYALTKHGASSIYYCNGEPAVITNPRNIPGCCKHIAKILVRKNTMKVLKGMAAKIKARKEARKAAREAGK